MGLFTATIKGTYALTKRLPALAAVSTAGWLGYTAFRKRDHAPLPDPFPSKRRPLGTIEAGRIMVHETEVHPETSDATPVLLVHSVNAAASSYEMKPLFQRLERNRHTVSLDLPGFGHSDRADRTYTPELMSDAIGSVLDTFDKPVHVIALSLGAEFAARSARLRPDRVESLTLISPTGFGSKRMINQREPGIADRVLDNSLVGQGVLDLLATDMSIRYFLDKSFAADPDPGLVAFASLTAHQRGAQHAPVDFLLGNLFTPDALDRLYEPLLVPTLVLYDKDPYTDFAHLPEFVSQGNGSRFARRIPGTHGLPHFEQTTATVDAIESFWKDIDG